MQKQATITQVSQEVASEAVRYMYGQASDALKKLREARKAGFSPDDRVRAGHEEAPDVFDVTPGELYIHMGAAEDLEEDLREVRAHVLDYATGASAVDMKDMYALAQVNVLRNMMEAIYGVHLTLKGETGCQPTGTPLEGDIRSLRAAGYFEHDTTVFDSTVPTPTHRNG